MVLHEVVLLPVLMYSWVTKTPGEVRYTIPIFRCGTISKIWRCCVMRKKNYFWHRVFALVRAQNVGEQPTQMQK